VQGVSEQARESLMIRLNHQETAPPHRLIQVGTGPYPALVLAEHEGEMWLASVNFDQPPRTGLTFQFQGMAWQLTWSDRVGFGAAPMVM
jgi:hypothetical protein